MRRNALNIFVVIMVLILLTVGVTTFPAYAATEIYLLPSINTFDTATTSVDYRWNVTIWVKEVTDLYAYQVRMYYDPTVINVTRAWLPTWDPLWVFYGKNTAGLVPVFRSGFVQIGDSILGLQPRYTGTGKLALVELRITKAPSKAAVLPSFLDIDSDDTYLLNFNLSEIFTLKTSGSYEYSWSPPSTMPYLAVSPTHVRQSVVGSQFDIEISIMELDPGWQITNATMSLCYNSTVIDVVGGRVNITLDSNWEGPNEVDVVYGVQSKLNLIVRNPVMLGGNLAVASITFTVMSQGKTNLTFCSYSLHDHVIEIPTLQALNGVANTQQMISDIAVINVKPLKTVVGQSYNLNISATVENQGDYTETFNITTYANTTSIASQTVTLEEVSSTIVTFTWNTTGFVKGNYTISAIADIVQGETDTSDNTFTDGWIIIAMVGDITGSDGWPDGKVDIRDIATLAKAFGSYPSHPNWNPNADITGLTPGLPDGKVDIRDIAIVSKNFGKIDP